MIIVQPEGETLELWVDFGKPLTENTTLYYKVVSAPTASATAADFGSAVAFDTTQAVQLGVGTVGHVIELPIRADGIAEGTEMFSVQLLDDSSYRLDGLRFVDVYVSDKLIVKPTVTMQVTPLQVSEGSAVSVVFTRTVTSDYPISLPLTIGYQLSSSTGSGAASAADFDTSVPLNASAQIVIPALSNSVTVTLPVRADSTTEGDEAFSVMLVAGSDYLTIGLPIATVTILDTSKDASGKYSTVGSYPITDCVKDNTTGLTWEGKPTSGFRAHTVYQSVYDSTTALQYWNGAAMVAPTQSQIDAITNSVGYQNAVNSSALCGYTNWRMPTLAELESLVLTGVGSPTIDTVWFPNAVASWSLTAIPYTQIANREDLVKCVDFNSGSSGYCNRYPTTNFHYLRLVRSSTVATAYTLGGSVSGLNGGDLVLNSNGQTITVAAKASSFSFPTPIASGASYNVVVESQPSGQNCTVSSGSGIMPVANVSSVVVSCVPTATGKYSTVGSYPITDCVKDNTTGLTWEGKPTSGFRASGNTYTNYDSTYGTQSQIDAATNSIGYKNAVNSIALCRYTDWRMPTSSELAGLVMAGVGEPFLDRGWFPNSVRSYWTSDPKFNEPSVAFFFVFSDPNFLLAGLPMAPRSTFYPVRLVR